MVGRGMGVSLADTASALVPSGAGPAQPAAEGQERERHGCDGEPMQAGVAGGRAHRSRVTSSNVLADGHLLSGGGQAGDRRCAEAYERAQRPL